jgi:hypothetical protein
VPTAGVVLPPLLSLTAIVSVHCTTGGGHVGVELTKALMLFNMVKLTVFTVKV